MKLLEEIMNSYNAPPEDGGAMLSDSDWLTSLDQGSFQTPVWQLIAILITFSGKYAHLRDVFIHATVFYCCILIFR